MSSKTKMLYVDDEVMNLELFKINFSEKYEVITAIDGSDGLEKLNMNLDVFIVISDMRMPGMTGIEFIKAAKHRFSGIFYFILTGYAITDQIKKALEDKLILEYFSKPFDIDDIRSTITQVLKDKKKL